MSDHQVATPVADLRLQPDGPRDRQLLLGATVQVLETADGWVRVQADADGYQGWLRDSQLRAVSPPTHWVSAAATHAYAAADFKSPDLMHLSFGSRLRVTALSDRFAETDLGHIPRGHLTEVSQTLADPVAVAELFLGTPYLWGGNSRFGIDCSGLVQAALMACGLPCPGDSGPQERQLGAALAAGSPYQRGDLMFWKGHVALVRDPDTLIHANAWAMAVALEPIGAAIDRILAQGDGPVTAHKRLTPAC